MNDGEILPIKLIKLKHRRGDQKNETVCKIGSHHKLGPPSLSSRNFDDSQKSTADSSRMHWNLMNDKECGSIKVLKLKYKRGDQKVQTFSKIGSLQKLGPPSLICRNFKILRKVLLNHAECIKI